MTPADAQALLFAMDAALTAAERIGKIVAEKKKEGLITVEEQQTQLDRIEALRKELSDD